MEKELIKIDEQIQKEANIIVKTATEFIISDKISCDEALRIGKKISDRKKQINDYFSDIVKSAYEAHKMAKGKQNEAVAPWDEAKKIFANKINNYNIELKRKQQEEEERIRKEAEATVEAEKKRLEAEALEAVENGDTAAFEKADFEAKQVTPESVMPVRQPKEKVKGGSENWQFEVIDEHALLQAVLGGFSHEAIIPNDKFLLHFAKATKGTINVPGVRFFDKGSIRF